MINKPLKWYYSAGFSHIPTKKQNSYLHHLRSRNFNESIPKMTKNFGARDAFSIKFWNEYKHHPLMFLMVNIPTSQRIGVGANFIATIRRQLGISPKMVFFFVGNPCKKWGKFRPIGINRSLPRLKEHCLTWILQGFEIWAPQNHQKQTLQLKLSIFGGSG